MATALASNAAHIEALCTRLDLGRARLPLLPVAGGFHHRMWRLETARGRFSVKQLAPDAELLAGGAADHFDRCESVAESFAGRGIPAVHALRCDGRYLQDLGDGAYLVYPWVDAAALPESDIATGHAERVAHILAAMHRQRLQVPGIPRRSGDPVSEAQATELVERAQACGLGLAETLRSSLAEFRGIIHRQRQAAGLLAQRLVVSHGDLDHKNVLWDRAGEPLLIDWECARLLNPEHELLLESLDWCGLSAGLDFDRLKAMLAAYREAGGAIDMAVVEPALHCIVGDWLDWLLFNLGRAMDLYHPSQRGQGLSQAELALATVRRLQRLLPRLAALK